MAMQDPKEPDWSKAERPHSTDTEKIQLAGRVISVDKDILAKSNIPQGFVMSVATLLSLWAHIESEPPYRCPLADTTKCKGSFNSAEEFLTHVWEEYYHIHQLSQDGRAISLFADIASTPFAMTKLSEDKESRMKEGNRK